MVRQIILKRLSSALAVCLRREVRDVACQTVCDSDAFNKMNGHYVCAEDSTGMVRSTIDQFKLLSFFPPENTFTDRPFHGWCGSLFGRHVSSSKMQ